jgi:hypothetical protein
MAHAAEVYARRQRLSDEIAEHAHAIKVDALTLMGEFLKSEPKNKGAKGSIITGAKRVPLKDNRPRLRDAGISKKESSTAQTLATLKQSRPELHQKVKAGARRPVG